jgi:hypothetical protein
MAVKYQQAFSEMWADNAPLFEKFAKMTMDDPQFHVVGKEVLHLVEDAERRLCGKMEGGGYGSYSGKLADKFRETVRKSLKYIDFVGCQIS